jgi:hypothetical protein
MGSYSGEIVFSGKAITIWGQGKVLDASGGGQFFIADGAGSFLELHNAVLQNGAAGNVSGWSASCHAVVELFYEASLTFCFNSWRGTCNSIFRTEGPSTLVLELLSSMIQPSTPTPLAT